MYRQFRSNIRVRLIEDEFKTFMPGDKPMKAHDIMRRLRQTITTNVKKRFVFWYIFVRSCIVTFQRLMILSQWPFCNFCSEIYAR